MKIKLLIKILLVIIICIVTYKVLTLYNYTVHYGDIDVSVNIKDSIVISSKDTISNPITLNNVKFENYFSEFKNTTSQSGLLLSYLYEDEKNNNQVFTFNITTEKIFSYINKKSGNRIFDKIDKMKILNKYNIKSDIDFIKYMSKRKKTKNTFFTSKNQLIENYFFDYLLVNEFPVLNDVSLIEGNFTGYIIYSDNMKIVNIIKDNKQYSFNFIGTKFDDEFIINFLNSLIIE